MKSYILYIVNNESNSSRKTQIIAKDTESARQICEKSYLKPHENLISVYPESEEPLK